MKKTIIAVITLLIVACTPVQQMLKSTVIVEGYSDGVMTSQGSGVITDHGILTAAHVIAGMDKLKVTYHNGKQEIVETETFYLEKRGNIITYDIALLSHQLNQQFSRSIQCRSVTIQQQVFAVGNPHSMSWVMTEGSITSIHPRKNQRTDAWIHTDAVITRGSSGGPIFNKRGQIVGIVSHMDMMQTRRSFTPSGFGFAVSGPEICRFLDIDKRRTSRL